MGTVQWDVDDRAMSWWTRVYVLGMRLARDKDAFEGDDRTRRTALRRQRDGDAGPTWLTKAMRLVTTEQVAGMTVWRVAPRGRTPLVRVVYVHGGGYVHPLTKDYWRLVRALSAAPAEVFVPAYPLAPGAHVDDVLPRLIDVVHGVGSSDVPVVLMGDSAGGALAMVLATMLRSDDGADVCRVVALCPWLDATLDESEVADLESTDPMLAESGLRAAGRWWATPRSPADPLVSPVRGSFDGLPPIDVVIGDRDILRPAVDDLARRARTSSIELRVLEVTAMFHVWMTRAIPEGRRLRRHLRRVLVDSAPPGHESRRLPKGGCGQTMGG